MHGASSSAQSADLNPAAGPASFRRKKSGKGQNEKSRRKNNIEKKAFCHFEPLSVYGYGSRAMKDPGTPFFSLAPFSPQV
jgi:hypothetical protein